MTYTPLSISKNHRLFVGKTAAAVADTDFEKVVNENSFTLSYKADNDKVTTKEQGQVIIPQGDESWEIKGTADVVLADDGLVALVGARNIAYPFQIRDLNNNTVYLSGPFIVSDLEWKNDAKGVTQVSFTMGNAAAITLNILNGGRAIVATGS